MLYIFEKVGDQFLPGEAVPKSSLYSYHYTKACNEWRVHLHGLAPEQHNTALRATQPQQHVAAVANRWRHCADLTDSGFKPQTFRTDRVCAKQLS